MGLTSSQTAAVVGEIAPAVTGGWIQKIFQPAARLILFEVRARGRTLHLLCSGDPETARLHLVSRRPPNPPGPPPFCQFLRAHVQGARIDGIEQVGGDRVVRIRLTAREGPCCLVAAMTGRTAGLILLDATGRIMASLDARDRPGRIYELPAAAPQPAGETPKPGEQAARDDAFPLSQDLERQYEQEEAQTAAAEIRKTRLAAVRRALKRALRRADALQKDLDKAGRYRDYARYGELLKTNLAKMKKGGEQVTVVDYFDPALTELTLPLDPAKGPQANMDDYFKKHRKFLAAEREVRPRIAETEAEIARLRQEQRAIEEGSWQPSAAVPGPPRDGRRPGEPHAGERVRSGPYRRFTSGDGLPIYVGRNAKENDELTFKFAHSDDLWLHARGMPGSHVVVRLEKGAEPPPETIRDAATLALQYSDLKKSGKGEVIYTRRKWVKKLKGQPPGTVAVTQEKSIYVQLDRARLERLKETSGKSSQI